ncbi:MAG: CDP-alcohol phosphatidyltransferase family protein [Phycisphaerales bacterium]|nr:CDP-alcohol phosphatidyltransferase family protein [Phycisphaerales bacterium]
MPPVSVIPTLCTLGNLIAGFAAIHYAAKQPDPTAPLLWHWTPLTFAGALVFLGMFLDAVDGSLARLTRSNSEIGAQLDSLADILTFGVAPAFMTIRLVSIHLQEAGWIIGPEADNVFGKIIWSAAAVYVCCAALRLARFNVEMGGAGAINDHSLFRGLPSPGAAGAVTSLVILHQHLLVTKFQASPAFVQTAAMGIPFVMLLCGFAMVSTIPYVHMTNRYVRGPQSFHYIVRMVVILALAIWWFQEVLAVAFTAYALSGPVRLIMHKLKLRRRVAVSSEGSADSGDQSG